MTPLATLPLVRRWWQKRWVRRNAEAVRRDVGIALPMPRFRYGRQFASARDCELRRVGTRYELFVPTSPTVHLPRIDSYLYWLTLCPPEVTGITADLSDGDADSTATFAMSSYLPDKVLLPDTYFFRSRGFVRMRAHADTHAVPWERRSEVLRWRGVSTGQGRREPVAGDPGVLPRIRLAMLLKDEPRCDVGIAGSDSGEALAETLRRAGLMRARIEEPTWVGDKYGIDIDGNSNTWSNFIVRLHLGCCMLKVDSPRGYRQWYYGRIAPWQHFVPVKSDLSDMLEKIDWVRRHDAEAREIAASGQRLARSMSFESESAYAVDAIVTATRAAAGRAAA